MNTINSGSRNGMKQPRRLTRIFSVVAVLLCAAVPFQTSEAAVTVEIGPTKILRGNATGDRDITISNGIFAVAVAVDTPPPWGVARGGILDIAVVQDGKPGYDVASIADFMPNRWSSWPTTYQHVTLETNTPDEVVVKTVRDWGDVTLETRFRIRDGDSNIHIVTSMLNTGESALEGLMTGYVVWPDGGTLFGVPGLLGVNDGAEEDALAEWSASYGEGWVLGLHAPFADFFDYGGRDRYKLHDLAPGESRLFEAWLQIENDGSLAAVVQSEIRRRHLKSGRLVGRVASTNKQPVARPAVILSKNGDPYAWTFGTDGRYEITLPIGTYDVYATAQGFAKGETRTVVIRSDRELRLDFTDVRPPGEVRFEIVDANTGKAVDARISIEEGYRPLIGHFGKNTFFTDLTAVGVAREVIAPGRYVFKVSSSSGFTSTPSFAEVVVEPAQISEMKSSVSTTAQPAKQGWYSADLHHHSDVLDGFTEAEFVLRSELAAGVDIMFLSDHDSVVNNKKMQALSGSRDKPFMAGTELSPSWAHFNAFPIDDDATVTIDTGKATVQQIFAAAREMGASLIEVNHPYSEYGYFRNDESNSIPGGFAPGFDLVEIVAADSARNEKTLQRVWGMWNARKGVYLAAGSDVHDVWNEESGSARTFAHVDGPLTIDKFLTALRAGNSYASQGPLIYPEQMFGAEIHCRADVELTLSSAVQSVAGLRSVQLIERGEVVAERQFAGEVEPVEVDFRTQVKVDTWFSYVIKDMNGKFAYTNPVWVTVEK